MAPERISGREWCARYGETFVEWLRKKTVPCKCQPAFGCEETLRRGAIDVESVISCRRCYVPVSLQPVRLHSALQLSILVWMVMPNHMQLHF